MKQASISPCASKEHCEGCKIFHISKAAEKHPAQTRYRLLLIAKQKLKDMNKS